MKKEEEETNSSAKSNSLTQNIKGGPSIYKLHTKSLRITKANQLKIT
jgi:hypothetical protein